ncbi:hypothetical protein [Trujillonella endophytica]|uniref:Uncharacterized protein n=1 Tax=Trujillonella endophytica TaxID=673521 RepID=A0A1H8SAH6_9ACTN|nr:hypothetical protein [Trujillella endophytica]SEO75710.1 hypothetical protein SAMN05660991_01558 [Trujillella endophytica]
MTTPQPATAATRPHPAFSALVGLTSLGVLLQGLWAGLFMGTDDGSTWVSVHQHGGEVTVVLALLATVAAVVLVRHRRAVVIATAVLFLALVVEYFLGYFAEDARGNLVVHVPLAMLLMGLAVYLPVLARRG